jgi:hypothetical protein
MTLGPTPLRGVLPVRAGVHHLFWRTNAILIQVNVAIGRSAEMVAREEDVFLGGLYHSGSVAEMRREWRYESR